MKNVFKFGFVAFALILSLSSCDFLGGSSKTATTDSLKQDSLTIDSLKQDTSTTDQSIIKADTGNIKAQKK